MGVGASPVNYRHAAAGGNVLTPTRPSLQATNATRVTVPLTPHREPAPGTAEHAAVAVAAQAPPWWPVVWQRLRRLFWIKLLGISAFMWVFFVAYFHTLRHPVAPVQTMPLTPLDHAITVQPLMLAAYLSLWFYVGIAPGLLPGLRALLVYGAWAAALCLVGLAIFYVYPTAVPRMDLPVDVAQHPGFVMLQGVDAAGNACPSLHVATALFTALWLQRLLTALAVPRWLRVGNVLWVLLIVYSTLAIKQHVVLDALAGAALGALFAWASMRWFPPPLHQRVGT